jgi:hypothetical protein
MTTQAEIPILEPKEEESKATLSKEKLESLKKARESRTRKARELNQKELDITHSLENIYNTLSILDTRLNSLDVHVRKRGFESENYEEEQMERVPKKIKRDLEEDIDEEYEPDESREESVWVTMANGAAVVAAFIVARFASDYVHNWARSTSEDKNNSHYDDYPWLN